MLDRAAVEPAIEGVGPPVIKVGPGGAISRGLHISGGSTAGSHQADPHSVRPSPEAQMGSENTDVDISRSKNPAL
jgi:hypothetical protein